MKTPILSFVFGLLITVVVFAEPSPSSFVKRYSGKKNVAASVVEQGFNHLKSLSDKVTGVRPVKLSKADIELSLKLALILIHNDPSDYTAELLNPIMQKYELQCLGVMKSWPAEDTKAVLDDLRTYQRSQKTGNG